MTDYNEKLCLDESSWNSDEEIDIVDDDDWGSVFIHEVTNEQMNDSDEDIKCNQESLLRDQVETDEEQTVPTLNAFSIPHIISNIMKHFKKDNSLNNLRFVDHSWNAEACTLNRKTSVLKFNTVNEITAYMNLMRESKEILYERISFENVKLLNISKENSIVMDEFLQKFGPRIRYCAIRLNEKISSHDHLFTLLYNMKELEELSVTFTKTCVTTFVWNNFYTTFQEFKNKKNNNWNNFHGEPKPPQNDYHIEQLNYPSLQFNRLQHISILFNDDRGKYRTFYTFLTTIFNACKSSLRSITCLSENTETFLGSMILCCISEIGGELTKKLRNLNFRLKPTLWQFPRLRRFVNLKRMKLVIGPDITKGMYEKAIAPICSTLEELELIVQSHTLKKSQLITAEMPRLRCLLLNGYEGALHDLVKTPALQRLEMNGNPVDLDFVLQEFLEQKQKNNFENVKSLKLTGLKDSVGTVEHWELRNLNTFRFINSLEIDNVTDFTLRVIYLRLPFLQKLKISGGGFSDVGITGISKSRMQDINETDYDYFRIDDADVRQSLYIGDLQELKFLSVSSDVITDASVIFGVAKLPKLIDLTLRSKNVTAKAIEAMIKFKEFEALNISGCENIPEKALSKLLHWGINIVHGEEKNNELKNDYNKDIERLMQFDHIHVETNLQLRDFAADPIGVQLWAPQLVFPLAVLYPIP